MESLYILRLAKELQRELNKLRSELYALCPDPSFYALEPCIILGSTDEIESNAHIPCPELPLTCERELRYSHHHLHIPVDDAALSPLRKALGISYPYSGIYLADVEIQRTIEPVIIKDLWFALLTIHEEGALKLWRVSSEKHLDSGKGR
ncbi:MAG: hypothetical protein VB127_13150 [Sphaerochaeta sp.]|nr:hypothetical protein [Sphaerochaeta sp.]